MKQMKIRNNQTMTVADEVIWPMDAQKNGHE